MHTRYLDLKQVIELHHRQINKYGGTTGIRDAGLIEATLLRPQTGYYQDLIEEAAALWESMTMNQGFVDGNKRVGFACLYTFLGLNGLRIAANSSQTLKFIMDELDDIKQAFVDHSVIAIRGLDISPEQHIAFAESWGGIQGCSTLIT